MYNQDKFIEILKKCLRDYSLNEYSRIAGVDAGYISRILNKKRKNPPSPSVLKKIADTSIGITTYEELMEICGYIARDTTFKKITNSLNHSYSNSFFTVPLFISKDGNLYKTKQDVMLPIKWDGDHSYFAYTASDDSMAPLLNIDDIAIIEKQETNEFENGKTYLLELENKILIRKIIDTGNSLELHSMNPYYPIIKTTKDKIKIIGKVIKAENQSAFK